MRNKEDDKKKVYSYLTANHVGFENRINGIIIRHRLKLNCSDKEFRDIVKEITEDENYRLLICRRSGSKGGYFIAETEEECDESIKSLVKRAERMQVTAQHMELKKINMFDRKDLKENGKQRTV